ncbi:EAL domain-containing protein (putative c-di-GMP-specific phosphodiesterase class I) [Ureibacillus xyleni]|uniref:EAL domain-containing protein (Putative c-di-GMP-specific phosphodiesterase class I) n=2 Tax=Ureibacillus xyleni TaxID=614648 RepID=A0A285RWE2_9BACL|nr:EAL domain-containing protein (putative c-di-GMP-specific phosphodiesterase class I) [Ureibacillus xyleni]
MQMDVLSFLDKIDEMNVSFEPIYSADEHVIVAYEVIGQYTNERKTFNITELTYDESIAENLRSEIELNLIKKAISAAKEEVLQKQIALYLPCNPNLLMIDFGDRYFQTLKELMDESLFSNIYLVIPEHKYVGDFEQLQHPIRYIKTYGVKIALDQIGSESNLDQILMFEPAVLKINVSQLNYNAWGAQNHVFTTIQTLAVKIGATLMFDNISTDYQLHHAWKNGARYFKGGYLQKPSNQFIPKDTLKERFRNECQQFISTEKRLLEVKYEEMLKLKKKIATIVENTKPQKNNDEKLLQLAKQLENIAFRFYICNDEGFQISPNIVRHNGKWDVDQEAVGKNWSWRPYFLFNIIKLRNDGKGELSSIYSDIETGELTRTYSMALNEHEYLFVDVTYDYLYEHNIVN